MEKMNPKKTPLWSAGETVPVRAVVLLALWLVLFSISACLILGRVLLLAPPERGMLVEIAQTADQNIRNFSVPSATFSLQPGEMGGPTPGRLTAAVMTQTGALTPVLETPVPGGSGPSELETVPTEETGVPQPTGTWNPLTPVFRVTSLGSPTATWFLVYYTPRPPTIIARATTRPATSTLLPQYRTATATRLTATAAARLTATRAAGLTATATRYTPTMTLSPTLTATPTPPYNQLAFSADNNPAADPGAFVYSVTWTGRSAALTSTSDLDWLLDDWRASDDTLVEGQCPDGNRLCRYNVASGEFSTLNNLPTGTNRLAVWSPNGEWIALENENAGQSDLYLVKNDGSDTRRLTNTAEVDSMPTWASTGLRLVWSAGNSLVEADLSAWLAGTPTDPAPAPVVIYLPPAGAAKWPDFNSTGDRLVFAVEDGGDHTLYTADTAGGGSSLTNVTALPVSGAGDDRLPSWSLNDAYLLLVSDRSGAGQSLYTFRLSNNTLAEVPATRFTVISRARWVR